MPVSDELLAKFNAGKVSVTEVISVPPSFAEHFVCDENGRPAKFVVCPGVEIPIQLNMSRMAKLVIQTFAVWAWKQEAALHKLSLYMKLDFPGGSDPDAVDIDRFRTHILAWDCWRDTYDFNKPIPEE